LKDPIWPWKKQKKINLIYFVVCKYKIETLPALNLGRYIGWTLLFSCQTLGQLWLEFSNGSKPSCHFIVQCILYFLSQYHILCCLLRKIARLFSIYKIDVVFIYIFIILLRNLRTLIGGIFPLNNDFFIYIIRVREFIYSEE